MNPLELNKKARIKWAHNVLSRVNANEKVSFTELEQANAIVQEAAEEAEIKSRKTSTGKPMPKWARSQVELSECLNCDRKTIQRLMKIEGNPYRESDGRYNVEKWLKWAKDNNRLQPNNPDNMDKADLERQRLVLVNERLEFELRIRKAEFTENAVIDGQVREMVMAAKKILLAIPPTMAPQVVGRSVADAEQLLKDAINDGLQQLHSGQWLTPAPKA